MNTDTKISIDQQPEMSTVNIIGNLDFSSYSSLYQQIQDIPKTTSLTVDLKNCDDIDSSGLGMLLLIRDKLRGQALITIENANAMILEKLEISKFDQLFRIA